MNPDHKEYVSEELFEILSNRSFWEKLHYLVELVEPLTISLQLLQADITISNVFHVWRELEKTYDANNPRVMFDDVMTKFITEKLNLRWGFNI